MNDLTPEKRILAALGPAPPSFRYVEECDSTNSLLKRLAAEGAPGNEPLFLAAGRQTGGRGRLGRSFFSPSGTGMYLSVLIPRPALAPDSLTLLTPASAVAVAEAIEELFGVPTGIKWVNDVYAGGKKVCGILTESAFDDSGRAKWAIVGIGVNVCPPEGGFPADIADRAGSVLPEYRRRAVEDLTGELIRRLSPALPKVSGLGFVDGYRKRLMYVGRAVDIHTGGAVRAAQVLGCDGRCGLLVRYQDGSEETLTSGEITVRERGGGI